MPYFSIKEKAPRMIKATIIITAMTDKLSIETPNIKSTKADIKSVSNSNIFYPFNIIFDG